LLIGTVRGNTRGSGDWQGDGGESPSATIDSAAAIPSHRLMDPGPHHISRAKEAERAARAARLAKALRENLTRRKEQLRARQSGPDNPAPAGSPTEPAA